VNRDFDEPIDWRALDRGAKRAQREVLSREKRRTRPGRPPGAPVSRVALVEAFRQLTVHRGGRRPTQAEFAEYLGDVLDRPGLSVSTVNEWRKDHGLPWPIVE
jgi:hypothetical protein